MPARRRSPRIVLAALLSGGCTVGGSDTDGLSGSAGTPTTDAGSTSAAPSSGSGTDASTGGGDESTGVDPTNATTTAAPEGSSGDASDTDATSAAGDTTGAVAEESSSSGAPSDLDDGILDITIVAHDDCTFTTMPASISVPEGTEFTVNWISAATSDIELDIAKIDQFNQVPIVIGMEPATSYHDEVRVWCGQLFTGTFDFRVTSCFDPHYIPVDCSG